MRPQVIPRSVAPAEALVRGIVYPFFYSASKAKLKPEAFLPPPGRTDVSLLRLDYTDAAFCKRHCQGLRVGDSTYSGLAVLAARTVAEAAQLAAAPQAAAVLASPLNASGQPVAAAMEVTTADAGLPIHADLVYSQPPEVGTPNPAMRLIARHLVTPARTTYYADPHPAAPDWVGPSLLVPTVAA